MSRKEAERLRDLMLGSFMQSLDAKDKTVVPLMIEVSTEWLLTMKMALDETYFAFDSQEKLEIGALIESVLMDIFVVGRRIIFEELKKKYKTPQDLFNQNSEA